jgi:Protein of unknown function (DUF429)
MSEISGGTWLAGIDGCDGGWVVAAADPQFANISLHQIKSFAELFSDSGGPSIAAVDMPIGLPERTGPKGRTSERLVRPLLGARQSSVFSIPSRCAVYAGADPHESDEQEDKRKAQSNRHRSTCSVARCCWRPGELHRYCLAEAGWTRRLGRCTRGIGGCAAIGSSRGDLISFAPGDRQARHSDCDLGLAAAIGRPGDQAIADGCSGYAALRLASISLRLMRHSAI